MDELIMAALENAKIKFDRLTMGDKEMILDIVKFVCKAQRNACAREFRHNRRNIGLSVAEKSIKNAEIRKEDYE